MTAIGKIGENGVAYCGGAPVASVQAHTHGRRYLVACSISSHNDAASKLGHMNTVFFVTPAEARVLAAAMVVAADVCDRHETETAPPAVHPNDVAELSPSSIVPAEDPERAALPHDAFGDYPPVKREE